MTPAELTSFRSVLGGLLWLTATPLDLVADVCTLQAQVTRATIAHLRQANNVVRRAMSEIGQGLVRTASTRGIVQRSTRSPTPTATWISYSTSHAETLAAISGLEAATLVAVRLAELFYLKQKATLQTLIAAQEYGVEKLPVDGYTDCRDFFELASGSGNVPQDLRTKGCA